MEPAETGPLVIGSDHVAWPLKESVRGFLQSQGFTVHDVGTHGPESVDYPDFGIQVAEAVSIGRFARGILLCGTGLGMSMVANRFAGVRAALCGDLFAAMMSRRHNDANVLVLGGRVTGEDLALEVVRVWLETPFDGGRHRGRLNQFDRLGHHSAVD